MSERIEDIIGDIRAQNQGLPEDSYALSPYVSDLLRLADRIEAAVKVLEADRDNWRRQALDEDARANAINSAANTNVDAKVYSKRDMAEAVVKAATQAVQLTNEKFARSVGNAAKMREALSDACYAMFNFLKTQNDGYEEMAKALDKAKTALAEPALNIEMPDVDYRFAQFCDLHSTLGEDLKKHCQSCQLWEIRKLGHNCALFWAQMPYKESKSET